MVITIAAYSRLAKVDEPPHELNNDCFDDYHIRLRENPKMPYIGAIESEQCYWETAASENLDFYAGNNLEFDEWCDVLIQLAHGLVLEDYLKHKASAPEDDMPEFYELVRYHPARESYDNWPAAVIGPEVAKKLYDDFKKFHPKIAKIVKQRDDEAQPNDLWFDRYESWMRAFELASDSGAVVFE